MSFNIEISEPQKMVSVKCVGEFDLDACQMLAQALAQSLELNPDHGVIVDLRAAAMSLPWGDMQAVALAFREQLTDWNGHLALLLERSHMKSACMLCMLVRPVGLHIEAFTDAELAQHFAARCDVKT